MGYLVSILSRVLHRGAGRNRTNSRFVVLRPLLQSAAARRFQYVCRPPNPSRLVWHWIALDRTGSHWIALDRLRVFPQLCPNGGRALHAGRSHGIIWVLAQCQSSSTTCSPTASGSCAPQCHRCCLICTAVSKPVARLTKSMSDPVMGFLPNSSGVAPLSKTICTAGG
jgi:hypothetical protein